MSGIFPHSWDGAIPPNPDTPDNPPQARKPGPYTQPTDTSALYYGLGCDVKIRAPVLNSIISELVSVFEAAGIAYQAGRLNNLALAISIIATRGYAAPIDAEVAELKKEVAELKRQLSNVRRGRLAA